MYYFVIWFGNVETDPLDNGVEYYRCYIEARGFMNRMTDKGYDCRMIEGKEIETPY